MEEQVQLALTAVRNGYPVGPAGLGSYCYTYAAAPEHKNVFGHVAAAHASVAVAVEKMEPHRHPERLEMSSYCCRPCYIVPVAEPVPGPELDVGKA